MAFPRVEAVEAEEAVDGPRVQLGDFVGGHMQVAGEDILQVEGLFGGRQGAGGSEDGAFEALPRCRTWVKFP